MLLLIRIQQIERADRLLPVGNHRPQQVLPVAGHALDGRRREQVGGVTQGRAQRMLAFFNVQRQIELGNVFIPAQHLDTQVVQALQMAVDRRLAMVEQHLEQRAQTQAALGLQGLHQLLERQVLMSLGLQRALAGLLQQVLDAHLPVDIGLEYLGVDEKADQPFGFHAIAVGNRHAHAHVFLTAVAV
ncbi:hypothetical protein [Pseudomonas sp. 25 E 4]|nr:hypothetical protein [Pseudomonas sp. 25 E 4]